MADKKFINGKEYNIIKLLGHGKGGYSYLAEYQGSFAVVKQIHHEPCDYYSFGNKIEAEKNDYERLLKTGIRIPKMYAIDTENEIVLKEFIDGETVFDLIRRDISVRPYIKQVREMADIVRSYGLNIDYFPTNFIVRDDLIWYVDYECNEYMDEYSFENWGIKYWSKTKEFMDYLANTDSCL